MPEQEEQRAKDIGRTWARIQRGGGDALETSADLGRLALYAYTEERHARVAGSPPLEDASADLSAMALAAALQKLAHVQTVAAEQQTIQSLLQFAAMEGLGISLHLRQQAAQAAAEGLGLTGLVEDEPAKEPDAP